MSMPTSIMAPVKRKEARAITSNPNVSDKFERHNSIDAPIAGVSDRCP
jgi:hypothetical protein